MYSTSVPSPPWNPGAQPSLERTRTATSPPPASPTSPTRTGRLRRLSYLRTYTQNHLLSRDSHSISSSQQRPTSLARATSYPTPTLATSVRGSTSAASPTGQTGLGQTSPPTQRSTNDQQPARSSNPDNLSSTGTSGWLQRGGGQSGVSRIGSEQESQNPSAVLAANGAAAVPTDRTNSMARTRSATVGDATAMPRADRGGDSQPQGEGASTAVNGSNGTQGLAHQLPSIRFSAHQDPRAQRPSLVFSPMARILPTGKETIKVGRYSERDNQPPQAANVPSSAPVGFKSKVVSRRHCEFWCSGGRWYIKDVKSSSGTFLNHIRLSSPGTESRPFPVNDGDIVQLGIDFKGGEEMIFRCVKIRVELNKGWQNGPTSFNVQSHKRLRELNNLGKPPAGGTSQDCSICLGPIAPCQSLFVAPCSHTWHYKCIRVIINGPHWPHFICPNCRSVADLEAELDDPYANGEWEEPAAADSDNSVQPSDAPVSTEAPRQTHQQENSNAATEVLAQADREESEQEQSVPSDLEIAEASDDSGVNRAAEDLGHMNLDASPSPSPSAESQQNHVSNATVAPVDIIHRKAVNGLSAGSSSRLERSNTRTPSPSGLSPSMTNDGLHGPEGPMTPRNDAGPFIFDGSAGRAAALGPAAAATMNLNAVSDTPLPQPTT